MANVVQFVYVFLLFFVLTPGVLVSLPPKSSKMVVAIVHALVFAIVFALTNRLVAHAFAQKREGATAHKPTHTSKSTHQSGQRDKK